ncbi:MAG: hypothetical protein KatS3mg110_1841 [Pirellulaceae bacterium]|nr:MAG: hypothetical protein KatS3mg110_1841 [Pirellulaceae bacterium]
MAVAQPKWRVQIDSANYYCTLVTVVWFAHGAGKNPRQSPGWLY